MLGVYLNNAICLSPDAKLLFVSIPFNAVGEPMTQVWAVAGQTPSLAMECHSAAVAPDAGRAVTARYDMSSRRDPGSYDNSGVKVFDTPSPTPRLDFKETGVRVAPSPLTASYWPCRRIDGGSREALDFPGFWSRRTPRSGSR